ncbi:MAG TPA: hypothetical protein ENK10_06955 [Acidobacteria bacterium]|nr:hypothetical protein [Acidobacteriota bacterium]
MKLDWDRISTLADLVAKGFVGKTEMQNGVRVGIVHVGRQDRRRILRIDIELPACDECVDPANDSTLTASDVG